MPRSTSPEALEAMFAQQTSEIILPLLTIDEAQLTEPIRIVHNTEPITRLGNVHSPVRFALTPPSEESGTIREVTLVVDNISRVIRDAIELATGQPQMTLEYIRADDPDGNLEAGPFDFIVEQASYTAATASIVLRYTEVFRLRYPQHSFIAAFFPDLFD